MTSGPVGSGSAPSHLTATMAFSKATDAIVRQLDPEGRISLIPAYSPYNADKLVLMSLVVKKNKRFVWQRTKYEPSIYTLNDILQDELSSVPYVKMTGLTGQFDDDYLREAEKNLTKEERWSRRQESLALKEKGNGRQKAAEHREAERSYTEALAVCPVCFSSDRAVLFSNRAAARVHLDLKDQAIADCSRAVELNPDYVRPILRRAELYEKTDKLDEALRDYKTVLEKEPGQNAAREACVRLPRQIHDRDVKMAFLPAKEFVTYKGTSGNTVGGMLGVEAGMAGVTLEATRTTKKQTPVGTLKREEVDVKQLMSDTRDRKMNMKHVLVKQLMKLRKPILTVLTERIVTTSTCTLSEQVHFEGLLGLTAETIPAKVKASANVQCDRDDSMVIPAGTVFAYKVVELDICCESGDVELCLYGSGGFYTGVSARHSGGFGGHTMMKSCAGPGDWEAWCSKDHFEIKNLRPLAELLGSTGSALFQGLCEVLKDRDALRDVENTLDEWCSGDAPGETEQDGSVSHSNSASAVLDLLRPYLLNSDLGPLTAVHILVSAMEALPDEALDLLSESIPDFLEAVNALVERAITSFQRPSEYWRLPPLDDKAFQWAQQLLITSNVTVKTDRHGQLYTQDEGEDQLPLVLHITVHGLSSLCGARMDGFSRVEEKLVVSTRGSAT